MKPEHQNIFALTLLRHFLMLAMVYVSALVGTSAFAQTGPSTVKLSVDTDYYHNLVDDTVYFIDDSHGLSVQDVFNAPEAFSPISTPYIDFGLTPSRVWLWSRFESPSEIQQKWRLDLNRQFIHELVVYARRGDGRIETLFEHSEFDNFHARPISDNLLVLDISVRPYEKFDIFVSYRSTSTTYLPIAIGTPSGVSKTHLKAALLDWTLNGALMAFMIFTALMFPVIGWRLGVSFGLYMIAGLFYVAHADGYTFQYLWPKNPELSDPLNLSFMLLMSVFGLSFSRILFNFKQTAPKLDLVIKGFVAISALFALLALFFVKESWFQTPAYAIVPLAVLIQVFAGFIALRRMLLGAKPYLFGALIVLSSIVYATMAHVWFGQFNLDTTLDYGHFALIAECFAFGCAIILRILGLRDERDKALTAELSAAQEKLDLASKLQKAQSDFKQAKQLAENRRTALRSVSHDIRQPLSSLRLAMEKMDGGKGHDLDQMHRAFDYLEDIAKKNISHSADSKGQDSAEIDLEVFPVKVVLDNVFAMFKSEVHAKGLTFKYSAAEGLIRSDPLLLMRAINNLMANAIHNTDQGHVELKVVSSQTQVEIHIIDTGSGMSEDQLQKAIQPNVKGPNSEGSGLGLSIVEDICKSLSATFEISSNKNRGTQCVIRMPVAAV